MASYRKRPVVVEAEQWFPGRSIDGVTVIVTAQGEAAFIETLEGRIQVRPGAFVVTGVAGEKYPCDEAIFRATYEPVIPQEAGPA